MLKEKGEKKKKKEEGDLWNVLEFGGMVGEKKRRKEGVRPEGSRGFGPFHFKPKAHAMEKEVPEDE